MLIRQPGFLPHRRMLEWKDGGPVETKYKWGHYSANNENQGGGTNGRRGATNQSRWILGLRLLSLTYLWYCRLRSRDIINATVEWFAAHCCDSHQWNVCCAGSMCRKRRILFVLVEGRIKNGLGVFTTWPLRSSVSNLGWECLRLDPDVPMLTMSHLGRATGTQPRRSRDSRTFGL